jgi:hypothetical protein
VVWRGFLWHVLQVATGFAWRSTLHVIVVNTVKVLHSMVNLRAAIKCYSSAGLGCTAVFPVAASHSSTSTSMPSSFLSCGSRLMTWSNQSKACLGELMDQADQRIQCRRKEFDLYPVLSHCRALFWSRLYKLHLTGVVQEQELLQPRTAQKRLDTFLIIPIDAAAGKIWSCCMQS